MNEFGFLLAVNKMLKAQIDLPFNLSDIADVDLSDMEEYILDRLEEIGFDGGEI